MKKTIAVIVLLILSFVPLNANSSSLRYQIAYRLETTSLKLIPNVDYGVEEGQIVSDVFQYSLYAENRTKLTTPSEFYYASDSKQGTFKASEAINSSFVFTVALLTDYTIFHNITISSTLVNDGNIIYPGFNLTLPTEINKEGICIGEKNEFHYTCTRTFQFEFWEISFSILAYITDFQGGSSTGNSQFPPWLAFILLILLFIIAIVIFEIFFPRSGKEYVPPIKYLR